MIVTVALVYAIRPPSLEQSRVRQFFGRAWLLPPQPLSLLRRYDLLSLFRAFRVRVLFLFFSLQFVCQLLPNDPPSLAQGFLAYQSNPFPLFQVPLSGMNDFL